MKHHIYADNAATTQLDSEAFEAMIPWLVDEYGNPSQPYSFSRKPKKALQDARGIIAQCINAQPDEIFFTSGGTESDNWAIKCSAFANNLKQEIITSLIEHHAVLNSCAFIKEMGYSVIYLNPNKQGTIETKELERIITKNTGLVSIMLVNNEIGTIEPVKELAEIAHNNDALFHTDAVQAVGHIPVDVKKLNVDLLSASAHKFNGPKGIGFLYIKKGTHMAPYLDGGAQESSMRAGTENVASIVGMSIALKNNCKTMTENAIHVSNLYHQLICGLEKNNISFRQNSNENGLPGLLSLSFPGFDGETILHRLDLMGISVSTGAACDTVNTEISHVLQAIQLEKYCARGTIRVSFGKNNSLDDVNAIVAALNKIVNGN